MKLFLSLLFILLLTGSAFCALSGGHRAFYRLEVSSAGDLDRLRNTADEKSAPNSSQGEAYFVTVKGVISTGTRDYIAKSLAAAENASASALVIKLDTPGGLLDATREIVQILLAAKIPVAVYVSPAGARAGSAGTFITLAADYAVMAEGTNIGAAHPVNITGSDIDGDMREKAVNDTVSFMRSVAEKRGRNIDEAVLTVTESKSFTASEALRAGLINGVVPNDEALLLMLEEELKVGELRRTDIKPTLKERVGFALSDPNALVILFLLGALMIFLEVKLPGSFIFAGIGAVFLVLFLVGINIIPVNWLGILLILAGFALIVLELFLPSFGVLAFAGVAALAFGMWFLFDTEKVQGVSVSLALIALIIAVVLAVVLLLGRLILKDFVKRPMLGVNNVVGEIAVILSWNGRSGQVRVHGEIWSAESEETLPLSAGGTVRVLSEKELVLKVGS